ncbi:LytR/AlgR family response regulator transcription factor [Paracidovorax wautersii]|uniref:DNA-binding response regulator, LytR/AlgR family n=1 Tax=Paracidovorax wautersii TaxID=1177982 RepID=A0A1I2HI27_9BURK|nr:LytTR family DNA-binding domain-containing protein [Paracidovorax wautersii]SFF29945.1 DNA-binding response regulator, LytR/AlgR family [Paracidovorax wautersii]
MPAPRALIAEDEPLLAEALRRELARAWPELQLAATVGDGRSAVREALALRPEVLFFDIRMPGLDGLEAAHELADAWPQGDGAPPFPALVFVTAYDQYAVRAFEAQAIDYVLKPVQPQRLARTVQRLQEVLARRAATAEATATASASASAAAPDTAPDAALQTMLEQLRALTALPLAARVAQPEPVPAPLQLLQAGVGTQIHLVPVQDVVYLEAADKYVRVLTAQHEYLVRTPLKELAAQLDAQQFWQIHRGTVVRATAIASATRDEAGRLHLQLRERPERLAVSRLYAHLFKAM